MVKKSNTDQQLFLDGLGEFKPTATHPTASAAMSAFIKAIRLRFTEDAIYWLHYLNTFPDQYYKICRRILLASGEDNLSVPVMHHASKYLTGWKTASLHNTATEVIRICKTKNWWEQPEGHEYIKFWRIATSIPDSFDGWYQDIVGELVEALADKDRTKSASTLIVLKRFKQYDPLTIAGLFIRQARMQNNHEAADTLQVMLEHPKVFKFDTNHLAQAHFRLFEGSLGEQENPDVDPDEVQELLNQAEFKWKAPKPIPSYYLDGMHAAGKDKRFAGIPTSMYGMCRAYKIFKRLHPDDIWPSDFWWKVEEK